MQKREPGRACALDRYPCAGGRAVARWQLLRAPAVGLVPALPSAAAILGSDAAPSTPLSSGNVRFVWASPVAAPLSCPLEM